jgi:Ribulose-5-phosphate 4-epimerase and related epimerases and aldolases
MRYREMKELVVQAGIELVKSGLIARTWGNVSCRADEDIFVITPSGRDYLSLTAKDIVEVKLSDLSYEGPVKPSSEKGIHAEVYRAYPEINFVIHTHQEYASAISAAGMDSIPVSVETESFSGKILCAQYALPGTKALRKNVAEALRKTTSHAVIMKNHGTICYGRDYESTFQTAHQLEELCREFISRKKKTDPIHQAAYHAAGGPLTNISLQSVLDEKGGCLRINSDPDVISYSRSDQPLSPFLDDFAQIVGLKAKLAENDKSSILKALEHSSAVFVKGSGAICWGKNESDAEAVSMILRKNCIAYFTASLFGRPKPIKALECVLMRFVYLKKYSRLSEK